MGPWTFSLIGVYIADLAKALRLLFAHQPIRFAQAFETVRTILGERPDLALMLIV